MLQFNRESFAIFSNGVFLKGMTLTKPIQQKIQEALPQMQIWSTQIKDEREIRLIQVTTEQLTCDQLKST